MAVNQSDTKHNLIYMYKFFQEHAPITVGSYLDLELPERGTDPEQRSHAEVLLSTLVKVSEDDLFDMDVPVTEASIIRGFSPNGSIAMSLLLKAADKGLL